MNIGDIKPYERNAKLHPNSQISQIVESIRRFGFNVPIVIDKNCVLIAGHGRLEAAKRLGMTEIQIGLARAKVGEMIIPAVMVEDLSEEEIKAYRLADNKLNETGWDINLVIDELKLISPELGNLTGFNTDLNIDVKGDENFVPEVKVPRSKLGDLYEIGDHRVLCGDATSEQDMNRLRGGGFNKYVLYRSSIQC